MISKDVGLIEYSKKVDFLNSLTQSLSRMQSCGIPAVSERRETDSQIVLTITIPKEKFGQ